MANQNTNWAVEDTLAERHVCDGPTLAACPACVPWVHSNHFSTACYCLVGEHHGKPAPRSIVNVFGEMMICNHAFDVQVLDVDSLILLGEGVAEFMEEIPALVVYPQVLFGYFEPRLIPVLAPLVFATEAALQPPQTVFAFDEVSGVRYDCAIGEGSVVLQPNIHADFSTFVFDFGGFDLATEYRIPLTGVVPLDSQSLHLDVERRKSDGRAIIPHLKGVDFPA